MLKDSLLLIVSLLFVVSMLAMLSDKLRISYPIFLVVAGLGISLIPGVPQVRLDPDIVFVIFLPPLLYSAAWYTSWHDFWKLRRPIGLLGFGLVLCTAFAVAYFSHFLIPDFSLALGFLLGGIISPPDAVAATSVLHNLKVPKRIVDILEGESLVNDASSLIVFRFALAAIVTGKFVLWRAGVDFLLVVFMGVLIGLVIAHIAYAIHRWLPTTSSIDTAISLICPYLMYMAAEHFHYSGVLAVVSGGLFLSYRSHDIFSYESRLQTISVWNRFPAQWCRDYHDRAAIAGYRPRAGRIQAFGGYLVWRCHQSCDNGGPHLLGLPGRLPAPAAEQADKGAGSQTGMETDLYHRLERDAGSRVAGFCPRDSHYHSWR